MERQMQTLLLRLAHESILEELDHIESSTYLTLLVEEDPLLQQKLGVFVTLKKYDLTHTKSRILRGCIGTIEGVSRVVEAIYHLSKESAFDDPRFLPLSREEYENIHIKISLLSPLKEINTIDEIILGTHGVVYEYRHHRALFLPEVAIEQHWGVQKLLNQLCIKASLPPEHYLYNEGKLSIFTVESFEDERG
ncbi:MAG: AmmeMemoRadiSam system protein A [Spirochaetia bacterium]|nr:AmmeMemoRadiSam system protein A [Spirochaetia bacterium]